MASGHEKLAVYRMAIGYVVLSRLGKRGYSIQEEYPAYRIDFDSDSDFDLDGIHCIHVF